MFLAAILGLAALWPSVRASRAREEDVEFRKETARPPIDGIVSLIDQSHIWVGLSYTADGGASWTARIPPEDEAGSFNIEVPSELQTAFFASQSRGWLSGLDSVWSTADGGLTWSRLLSNVHIHALGFTRSRVSGWMAVGENEHVWNYITRDSGHNWSKCGNEWQLGTEAPLSSISLLDDATAWATVARYDEFERPTLRGVARSADGGCTWKVIWWEPNPSEQDNLGEIQFANRNLGWLMAGGHGRLRQTKDGGLTWRNISLPAAEFHTRSGVVVDPTHGWILGWFKGMKDVDSGIFFTEDAGAHWRSVLRTDLALRRGSAQNIPHDWPAGVLEAKLATHRKTN